MGSDTQAQNSGAPLPALNGHSRTLAQSTTARRRGRVRSRHPRQTEPAAWVPARRCPAAVPQPEPFRETLEHIQSPVPRNQPDQASFRNTGAGECQLPPSRSEVALRAYDRCVAALRRRELAFLGRALAVDRSLAGAWRSRVVGFSLVGLFALFVAAAASGGPGSGARSGPKVNFLARCTVDHSAMDDPIVHFGHPGASHDHTFFGIRGVTAFSTVRTVRGHTTTCTRKSDTGAYWVPTLYRSGRKVTDAQAVAYYTLRERTPVHAYPHGLRSRPETRPQRPPSRCTSPGGHAPDPAPSRCRPRFRRRARRTIPLKPFFVLWRSRASNRYPTSRALP